MKIIVCADSKTEWNFSFAQHYYLKSGRNINPLYRCLQMTARNRFSLQRGTTFCKKLPSLFEAMPVSVPLYFEIPSIFTIDVSAKYFVVIRWQKMIVNLAEFVETTAIMLLNQENMPKAQLPRGLVTTCQTKEWMTKWTNEGVVKFFELGDQEYWEKKGCLYRVHLTVI
jgi:hypothetical protein